MPAAWQFARRLRPIHVRPRSQSMCRPGPCQGNLGRPFRRYSTAALQRSPACRIGLWLRVTTSRHRPAAWRRTFDGELAGAQASPARPPRCAASAALRALGSAALASAKRGLPAWRVRPAARVPQGDRRPRSRKAISAGSAEKLHPPIEHNRSAFRPGAHRTAQPPRRRPRPRSRSRRGAAAAPASASRRASRPSRASAGITRAQPRPGEARIAVRWIFREGDAGARAASRAAAILECRAAGARARVRFSADRQRRHRRHRAEPGETAAASHPDQHRLGLIVERVCGEDVVGLRGPAPRPQADDSALAARPPAIRSPACGRSSAASDAARRDRAPVVSPHAPRPPTSARKP